MEHHPTALSILVISDDPAHLAAAKTSCGEAAVVTHLVDHHAGLPRPIDFRRAEVCLIVCPDLNTSFLRPTLHRLHVAQPGLPVVLCTEYSIDNLRRAVGLMASGIVELRSNWHDISRDMLQYRRSIDLAGIAARLRSVRTLKPALSAALAAAVESVPPQTTVRGLAAKTGYPESSLRRDYHAIASDVAISLPDFLHAVALAHVVVARANGSSLARACLELGTDLRTLKAAVSRVSGDSVNEVTGTPNRYRQWLRDRVLSPFLIDRE